MRWILHLLEFEMVQSSDPNTHRIPLSPSNAGSLRFEAVCTAGKLCASWGSMYLLLWCWLWDSSGKQPLSSLSTRCKTPSQHECQKSLRRGYKWSRHCWLWNLDPPHHHSLSLIALSRQHQQLDYPLDSARKFAKSMVFFWFYFRKKGRASVWYPCSLF